MATWPQGVHDIWDNWKNLFFKKSGSLSWILKARKKHSGESSLPLGFGYFKKEIDNKNFSRYNYLVVVNFLCSYGHQNLQEEYYDDEIYGISTNNIQITDTPIIKNNAFY